MKATLKLKNIGQKIGEEIWEFNSGTVTEIRGRTASGKSRILKSCALALSLPITSEEIKKNAISFGIARADNAKFSPLLNSNENSASIELQYDGVTKIVELNRNGNVEINIPGNQKFLYCSMLAENSKIHNSIDEGLSDFSWIVTEMSLAKNYENVQEIANSYIEVLNAKKEEIEKKQIEKKKSYVILNEKKKEFNKVNNEIEKIEKEIDAIDVNPQLKQQRMQIVEELKTSNNKLRESKKDLKELRNKLSNFESNLDKNNDIIANNGRKMGELVDEQKVLLKINVKSLNDQIENLRVDNENLYKSEKEELQNIGGFKSDQKRLDIVFRELTKTKKNETLCWTCGKSTISKEEVERELEEIKKKINPLQKKITTNERKIETNNEEILKKQKIKKKKNEIPLLEKQIQEYNEQTIKLQKEKNTLDEKIKRIKLNIPKFEGNIESRIKKIQLEEKKLNQVEDKLEEHKLIKPKLDEKNTLTKKLGSLEKEISDLESYTEQGNFIELFNSNIEISKAKSILTDFEEIFGNVSEYLVSNIKEQREGAAIKFNNNIQKIITELDFSEFKEILLDLEDYNLIIVRKNETLQPINSLSGGEKVVVSSLLQISAKETYNPDIPFIIGDDIILKMDDSRRKVFENYLKNIAKTKDWFIILTRVTDEDLIKSEI